MNAPVLNLTKNSGFLDLKKVAPSLTKLRGALNWKMHPVNGEDPKKGFDLDIFVFGLNDQKKVSFPGDVAFFNNKWASNNSIGVPKDNQTGKDVPGEDDEYLIMDLTKVPADKHSFDIFVFIHEAAERGQNFGMVSNATFELKDDVTKNSIQAYNLSQFTTDTAVHIGTVSRNGAGWNFSPVGEAAPADPNQVVQAYL